MQIIGVAKCTCGPPNQSGHGLPGPCCSAPNARRMTVAAGEGTRVSESVTDVCRGGMVQTNEQYEFVHYVVSVFSQQQRHITRSPPITPASSVSSSSSSSSSTPTRDDNVCDLK